MNADSVSFRFPSMLVFGHEADELDLIDQFIPVRLGLGIGKVSLKKYDAVTMTVM